MATEETLPFFRCVTAAGARICVALGVVQQIMKQKSCNLFPIRGGVPWEAPRALTGGQEVM